MGVSENRGPRYRTLNSRILIIRTPKYGTPNFRKLPYGALGSLKVPSWVVLEVEGSFFDQIKLEHKL